jgi:hypothetical protein
MVARSSEEPTRIAQGGRAWGERCREEGREGGMEGREGKWERCTEDRGM